MITRLISWNVNGIRACLKKGFETSIQALAPDFLCLQETKCQAETLPLLDSLGYAYSFFNYAEKKGYSGTAIFTHREPENVNYDIVGHTTEGRVITLHYPEFILVNAYVPNSGEGLKRLHYRTTEWEPAMRDYLNTLAQHKSVIYCGDLNVAHQEIDLANPSTNHNSAGFTDEERAEMSRLLDSGLVDTFRHLYPDTRNAYSWWSYRAAARVRNVGWRIDYFLISPDLTPRLKDATIHPDIHGSDHCPVGILLDL